MLTQEQNELLTRIGPDTPMGDMLREYWVPACRAAKLEADGAPERVRLFGENFVAFRGTSGRVGFIAEGCPHRCASMALARNEGDGLRCIFHGWKVNVEGRCVDTPTEPEERRQVFAGNVPVRSHPVREAGGLIWVYLGKHKDSPPRFPDYEFTHLPDSHIQPSRGIIKTNWLQGLEALLDSAHVTYLHAANLSSVLGRQLFSTESDYMLNDGAPTFEFVEQPYGFREGALRDGGEMCYARVREVALPFFSFIPSTPGGAAIVCCSIPIDDETTAQWYIAYNPHAPFDADRMRMFGSTSGDPDYFNSDMGDRSNNWNQDRQAMKEGHWSGIVGRGNAYEDFAVQESMGPIVDRSREFLGTCDHVIIRARSQLLRAVNRFQETGETSFNGPEVQFDRIRAISFAFPKDGDWKSIDAFNPPAMAAE